MPEPTSTTQGTNEPVTTEITSIWRRLDLDETIQQYAMLIITEIHNQSIQVRSPSRTATAGLLMACRLREVPVRVTVLADQTSATKAQILNEMQRLSNELDIAVPLDDPTTILENLCRELTLPEKVENRAIRLADIGDDAGITSGVSPYAYSAAVLYIVCAPTDCEFSQAEIASHLDVSTTALRNRRDDLLVATGSQLFEIQFPNAPAEAVMLVDDLLHQARTATWATNKRFLGILGGAWLYAAEKFEIPSTAAELAVLTGVSEATIRARYEQFVDHIDTSNTILNPDLS